MKNIIYILFGLSLLASCDNKNDAENIDKETVMMSPEKGYDLTMSSKDTVYRDLNRLHVLSRPSENEIRKSIIAFDLKASTISEVDSAMLYLSPYYDYKFSADISLLVKRVSEDWNSESVKYKNLPNTDRTQILRKKLAKGTDPSKKIKINVTDLVARNIQQGRYTQDFLLEKENLKGDGYLALASCRYNEKKDRPKLVVYYKK